MMSRQAAHRERRRSRCWRFTLHVTLFASHRLQVTSHQSLDEMKGTTNMKRSLLFTTIAACLAAASLAQAASFTGLGLLSGYPNTWGLSVSADGSVVAGFGTGGTPAYRAFRWRQSDGFTPIYGPYPPPANCLGASRPMA